MLTKLGQKELGETGVVIPPLVVGISYFGDIFQRAPRSLAEKLEVADAYLAVAKERGWTPAFDGATLYGHGRALESIGEIREQRAEQFSQAVQIVKYLWYRVLGEGDDRYEDNIWPVTDWDVEARMSHLGMVQCHELATQLLGVVPQIGALHDPDAHLDRDGSWDQIHDALGGLVELRESGRLKGIGVGAKNLGVIQRIVDTGKLDYVMLATIATIIRHPPEMIQFCEELKQHDTGIINSAVFNAGFAVGGAFLDYDEVQSGSPWFEWREIFNKVCQKHDVSPAAACIQFGLSFPGVTALALNTSSPKRVGQNAEAFEVNIPSEFWNEMKRTALPADLREELGRSTMIDPDYPFV